jgi:hypothetical protein
MKRYEPHKFEEYFKEILHDYQGYNVYDTEHSVSRYKERVGKDIFLYMKLLKKGINWIVNNNKENVEDRYIFVSKKYGFGIQVEWRKDRVTKQFNGYSATSFSNNEMEFFTKGDKELFLEQLYFEESKEKALDRVNNGYYRYGFTEETQKEMDICGFDLYIQSGEISYNFEMIEL